MPCGRLKRIRQAEVVTPEFNAFKRTLKLTILVTLATEQRHSHTDGFEAEHVMADPAALPQSLPALGTGSPEPDVLLQQLRRAAAQPLPIDRKEA